MSTKESLTRCQKRKQTLISRNLDLPTKLSRCHENRKNQKLYVKTDCPFCGVTLTCGDYADHVKTHTLDLFAFKKVKKRSQQNNPQPSHKKEYANVLKLRCERPQAQSLCSKSEFFCPFCKERFVLRNAEEKQNAKNHLESCKDHNLDIALELLQVPTGASNIDDSAADTSDPGVSDDYLGSDMLRITGSDENEILDIENDDTVLYGPSQYSDGDVSFSSEFIQSSINQNTDEDSGIINDANSDISENEQLEERSWQEDFSTVEGLRKKIKEMQETRGSMCPVCKDVYRTPLTAIDCWHVLCEQCWLTALAVKKICPVCKTIVSSDALRRVYL